MSSPLSRALSMVTLVVAGEAVFFLPFLLPRIFRPTLLDVLQIDNLQLGFAFMVYGIVAMLAYGPGGPLADRFLPGRLMSTALLATAMGGVVCLLYPSPFWLSLIYGFWGLTTILLFWAPLIRATRSWGHQANSDGNSSGIGHPSGLAFGLLDGGRGLLAAVLASSSVYLFAALLPEDVAAADLDEKRKAFGWVIVLFTMVTAFAAAMTFTVLPAPAEPRSKENPFRIAALRKVAGRRAVWLQAVIVVCSYVSYKGLDDVSLYANEVLGFDEVRAAGLSGLMMWCRPPAAIVAGLAGDRFGIRRMTLICFAIIAIGFGVFAMGWIPAHPLLILVAVLLTTSAAVFALRGLYFAIMDEGDLPVAFTGTAVGLVSAIGFTPDVFMGPVMGWLLERSPGEAGHLHLFALLAVFAVIGWAATLLFPRAKKA
ncbi:MAG: MFS transporter [Planctomycetota bacterium]